MILNLADGDEFVLSTPYEEGTIGNISIVVMNGRVVFEEAIQMNGNVKIKSLDLISAGIYNVIINVEGEANTLRLLRN